MAWRNDVGGKDGKGSSYEISELTNAISGGGLSTRLHHTGGRGMERFHVRAAERCGR